MTTTVGKALAKPSTPTPSAIVASYSDDFAAVLPSHVKAATWVRIAQGALKKGKKVAVKVNGELVQITELEQAALNNPGAFMAALLEAARLGLEPGTEEYYLTARKVSSQPQILGIVGYQGYIELMYRAGAVETVVADNVFSNDVFIWRAGSIDTATPKRWEGPQTRPFHDVDWDSDDRGSLRLVYAYAIMKGTGAVSKVVVLNRAAIDKIKQDVYIGKDSPWIKHEPSMWLKSAVRQLRKWVPTSSEYRNTAAAIESAATQANFAPALDGPKQLGPEWIEDDSDITDGEVVDEQPTEMISQPQSAKLHAALNSCGITKRPDALVVLGKMVGRALGSSSELTANEATLIIDDLGRCVATDDPAAALDQYLDHMGGE